MTELPIKFGTDGWRGVIARDFTFANLRRAAQATAEYFGTVAEGEKALLVGFDVRFLSSDFARTAAEVIAGNGFRTLLLDRVCPTPYISFEVRRLGLRGGIVITASHNPADFNGFKVKGHYGGSATAEMTEGIEERLGVGEIRSGQQIETIPPSTEYFDHLRALVDWPQIARSGLVVCADPMHGSGGRLLEELLRDTTCEVHTIRARPDPLFGGVAPEPIMSALAPLSRAVLRRSADVGLATDGDADRLGVVGEDGVFVSTLQVLPLLLLHAYRNRGWRGSVVHTFSQSQLVGRIARSLGLRVHETPIGFKHIAEIMLREDVLIGGEESGGIGLSRHLPERDGLFLHLMLLDLLATTGRSVTELIQDMWAEFGEFHYDRRDLSVPLEVSRRLIEELAEKPPDRFAALGVREVQTLDGIKLMLEEDAWILFRRSGTEPVLRIYCEATSRTAASEILSDGVRFVEQFPDSGV
jgi:phosphomannomutase